MLSSTLKTTLAALALASTTTAQTKGFNYGSTNADGSCRAYADFVRFFNEAKSLPGASDFTTARLYTSIQCGSSADPISAFQAAIDTDTKILVGLWASAGRDAYQNELNALIKGANELGSAFTDRIIGISVGSEDLYRSSPQGVANNAGVGATGAEIEGYIGWLRDWVRGTGLEGKPVGHVDTWTAWVLGENAASRAVLIGLAITASRTLRRQRRTPLIWPGRTSLPRLDRRRVSLEARRFGLRKLDGLGIGPNSGDAVASLDNSKRYWDEVGCSLFGERNTFWYTLKDANSAQTDLSFAITPLENNTPFFDLSC